MAKTQTKEVAVIDFEKFSVAQLPELQGKKEEIKGIIEANPVVDIVDNSTYELAKKSRTAVRSLRTSLENEQKTVKKKIKEHILDVVDKEYDTLVLGVKSAEQIRQEPITAWEDKKEQERQEKARLEEERINKIKSTISLFKQGWETKISELKFEGIDTLIEDFNITDSEFDRVSLQEFEVLFDDAISSLRNSLDMKIHTLHEQEQIRIDNLLIQEKNAENYKIQDWLRVWNANIDTLTFNDVKDVKSVLVKSKLANLKHYSTEYNEFYTSTEKRLNSQIELISKAENQRIAQEKFQKEKAELERKQEEVKKTSEFEIKIKNRIIELVSYGLKFDFNSTYTDGNFFVDILDIKTHDDKKWDLLISDIIRVQKAIADKEIIESVIVPKTDEIAQSLEPLKEENILEYKSNTEEDLKMASEILENYHEEDVHEVAAAKTDSFVERMIPIVDQQNLIDLKNAQNELLKEVTWESILEEFNQSGRLRSVPAFIDWLNDNYNVPTKK